MTRSTTPTRAAIRAAIPALGIAALAFACPAQAFTPTSKAGGESTPLNIPSNPAGTHTSTAGPSLVRTIVGLLIVIAVIWGLTWVLRQVKSGRTRSAGGAGLTSLATLPLGSGRTLHLVRAGRDYLLLGSAEHGVVSIGRYDEQQALDAGLLDLQPEAAGSQDGAAIAGARGARTPTIHDQGRGPGTGGVAALLDRLREWTVRR
jgi:flagellar protein FliO/FliZ